MHKKTLYRRKAKGLTDYKKRLDLLKSRKPRLVIRRSLNNVVVQVVEYDSKGDKVITSAHSNSLKKYGWKLHRGNSSSAYLTGLMCGLKAQSKNIKEAVFDHGICPSIKGSVLYAALKGVLDSELNVPASEDIIPSEERYNKREGFKEVKEKIIKEKW